MRSLRFALVQRGRGVDGRRRHPLPVMRLGAPEARRGTGEPERKRRRRGSTDLDVFAIESGLRIEKLDEIQVPDREAAKWRIASFGNRQGRSTPHESLRNP